MTDKAIVRFDVEDLADKLGFPPGTRIVHAGFDPTWNGIQFVVQHPLLTHEYSSREEIPATWQPTVSPDGLRMLTRWRQCELDSDPEAMAANAAWWGSVSDIMQASTPKEPNE